MVHTERGSQLYCFLSKYFNSTGSVEDLPWRPKCHETKRLHVRYIRVSNLSERHRAARATARHILEHINDIYGRDDINLKYKYKSKKVLQYPNFEELDLINKWKDVLERFFSIVVLYFYNVLFYVQIGNALGINVIS